MDALMKIVCFGFVAIYVLGLLLFLLGPVLMRFGPGQTNNEQEKSKSPYPLSKRAREPSEVNPKNKRR